ncbi:MAG: hypothetical protein ACR2KO_14070 [Geodermatophilaceae bacterium]|jgi:hypothetical protein|nr:hypothetical protein [Gemmatimonadota bacterium]
MATPKYASWEGESSGKQPDERGAQAIQHLAAEVRSPEYGFAEPGAGG